MEKTIHTPLDFFISTSAIGIYPINKKELLNENSELGNSFLANLCKDWEAAANTITQVKRKLIIRTGVVIHKNGGALKKMLPVFKAGIGGKLGDGKQYFPWVALDDVVEIINFSLTNKISGVFNTTSPDIITNQQFTKALSNALKRPAVLPVPTVALKLMFGQPAEETLLMSTKVSSEKLVKAGYKFKYSNISEFFKTINT